MNRVAVLSFLLVLIAFYREPVATLDTSLDRYREAAAKWLPDVEKLAQNNSSAGSPETIVCLGSSSFRIWDSIEKDMAPYRMVRRAYGSAKYCDLAIHVDALIAELEFKAAAIYVGNDVAGKTDDKSPDEIARLASKVIESIRRERPDAKIFLIALTPTPVRFGVWPQIQQANAALKLLAESTDNVYFISTQHEFLSADGQPRAEFFQEDRLHLNEQGYALWSSILKKHFGDQQLLPSRQE